MMGERKNITRDIYISYDPKRFFNKREKLNDFKTFVNKNFSSFEKEVFKYMIKGYSYREIAEELQKSPKN